MRPILPAPPRIAPPRIVLPRIAWPRFVRSLLPPIRRWRRIARARRALRGMNDHMLRDIGVSREDALAEAARPFWDAR